MTDQERNTAFQTEIENLMNRFGYTLEPQISIKNLDSVVSVALQSYINMGNITPTIRTVPIAGWQPSAEQPKPIEPPPSETPNGNERKRRKPFMPKKMTETININQVKK